MTLLIDGGIIGLILLGIHRFRSPRGAVGGNIIAAASLALAVLVVAARNDIVSPGLVVMLLALGAAIGWVVAVRVSMIQTPALVAFQHGAGAVAALLVCSIELVRTGGTGSGIEEVSGITGLVLGGATLTGSMLAAAKLANLVSQPPRSLRAHTAWLAGAFAGVVALSGVAMVGPVETLIPSLVSLAILTGVIGLLVSMRIGGADMPVLISFLNATAGLSAAFAGVVIGNRLLVAAGATVAASGSVLTLAMCRAMNRRLSAVFAGTGGSRAGVAPKAPAATAAPASETLLDARRSVSEESAFEAAVEECRQARSVIFVPGYGMAMAQAQHEVADLADWFEEKGSLVRFAIHPVAGRMPGHMHVLLSEADVPWDSLRELDINPEFSETDLCIVIGASDVVNPAATTLEDTPISGMPILQAHEARRIIVINLDERPGYSGVPNDLYDLSRTIAVWGDAKKSLRRLLGALSSREERAAATGV